MSAHSMRLACAGALLWTTIALPPLRHALEGTMVLYMPVELPLLALAGWLVADVVPPRMVKQVARWNAGGISGFLLASMAGMVWMLPRTLDAALGDPSVALAKFVSVPLLVGAPLALSWPRMGSVVRGVFLVELIATAFRLGWLYLVSPVRLCSNYLLADQQTLGKVLLAIGCAISALLAWKLLWGHIEVGHSSS